MYDDTTEITVKEVDAVLSSIENKFSPVKIISTNNYELDENLAVLSKELDSIGIPAIDFSQPLPKMFEELVCNARSLVQIHRNTLAQMKDANIINQCNNVKNNRLHKIAENYKTKITFCENQNAAMQNRIEILEQTVRDLRKREADMKNEIEKVKRYHSELTNEYSRKIKKLTDENDKLKEYATPNSKDEILVKFVGKFKKNEEIYKSTIKKLEETNRQLVSEIVDSKYRKEET